MVQVSTYKYPPGQFANYYANGGKTVMPPGMYHAIMAIQNYPDSLFLTGGASHVAYKQGANISQIVAAGTPRANTSVFIEHPWIWHDALPTKTVNTWSREETRKAVDDFILFRSGGMLPGMLVMATEAYDYTFDWRLGGDYAPQQLQWVCERIAERAVEFGGCIFNPNYYGDFDAQSFFYEKRTNDLIAPLLNPDTAVQFLKGNEHPETKYFLLELWKFGTACLVSGYRLNNWTDWEFIIKATVQVQLLRRAIQSNQIYKKPLLIEYHMPEGSQFENYSDMGPVVQLPSGTIQGGGHNRRSYGVNVGQAALTYTAGAEMRSEWGDCFRYGVDVNVLKKNRYDQNFKWNGKPFTEIEPIYGYQPEGSGIGSIPNGNWNAQEDGARWKCLIYALIGNNNAQECRHRLANGSYNAIDGAYIIRQYQTKSAVCWKYGNSNGDWAVEGYTPEGNWATYQFDVPGQPEVYLPPNQPFLIFSRKP